MQWELTHLETKLSELDFERSRGIAKDLNNGSYEADDDTRQDLIQLIKQKLREYRQSHGGCNSLTG